MLDIVLYQPEIPPNTGNIMRLCANTGCALHLIEPLGFDLEEKKLRRAGLDYRDFAEVRRHPDLASYRAQNPGRRLLGLSTKASRAYHEIAFREDDALLFGPETRGLPEQVRESLGTENCLRIPMRGDSRSLNLSNAVALVTYEALRQLGFPGLG
ncbi:tRNA (cytidine(34)-2'-O)-methyltransferase [Mangrovimicrobium sediminis]|uniref:tRNA (cytidine(34)-2'-O)-methyltransferase n=1 Tax=Mangrovimicrobium sediminis TaxID=2562682 RepID=A0A4Z0LZT1_9GAMM|nr:tRNA (cytidine(34)-2'-O)-methyltransferase [Haliea sp. SAOS-164]TGD72618.1 tRNA (cytidine(34)-2'-O)-methyltransferase [Haliea sp. SAOS-164]